MLVHEPTHAVQSDREPFIARTTSISEACGLQGTLRLPTAFASVRRQFVVHQIQFFSSGALEPKMSSVQVQEVVAR